jgi:DNA-binding NtrC family response regulator
MTAKLLIVDDEPELLESCARILRNLEMEIVTAGNGVEALELLSKERPNIVLTDLKMPGMDGLILTEAVHKLDKEIMVLIMTGYGTMEMAVQAIKQGAFDFITKPFSADQLRVAIQRAVNQLHLVAQNKNLRCQLAASFSFDRIAGLSPAMLKVFEMVRKVAPSEASVLILGESGTGKELFARSLHSNSRRAHGPFIPIDCASLPENLLESELFGHERGAFTGATQTKAGLLELAHGGTAFLDELGELPLSLQAKLLRALQERSFRRVGGSREITVDIRLIAATNRNLRELVRTKTFREDLFYRLNVISLELPPLRERSGDVILIAQRLLEEIGKGLKMPGISPEARKALELYHWPGNIRELRNAMERAVALTEGLEIQAEDLPPEVLGIGSNSARVENLRDSYAGVEFTPTKEKVIEEFELAYLHQLLQRNGDNMTRAALEAGIDRKTLYRLLQKHNLTR